MRRAILSAALAAAFVAAVSAQAKPDFTGEWKPDPQKSKPIGGLGGTQTITVEGSKMTITLTTAGNSTSRVYLLDGTPSKNMVGPADNRREVIYTSKWDGNVLVTTYPYNPAISDVERRSIEPDGTMKVAVTHHFNNEPGKSETSMRAYNKVK